MADGEKFVLVADGGDIARAAELRRIKALATLALAGCVALLILARVMERVHPAFGFVAAFAEAATIGGLADWYAVVALFRRPLGLPIPHTAIIQRNQHRIADKLGEFIEVHFLSPAPVEAKLREVDSRPSSPTGCAMRRKARISRASCCACCPKRWRRWKHPDCARC